MEEMPMIGTIFLVVGILMAIFRRAIGVAFCKLGKQTWKNNPFGIPAEYTDRLYDERKAPGIMLLMGVVFAAEGFLFWFLPTIVK